MKNYITHHEWKIIEKGFQPEHQRISESLFSIGNGSFGQRANFEEYYSDDTHQGFYVAGVYYPDKTRVGWWKNGYPEYFAKVLNAPSWIDLDIDLAGERLDLAVCKVENFERTLDMQTGLLQRTFTATTKGGKKVSVVAERFCSMADGEAAAIRYAITPLNFSGEIKITSSLNADVVNKDSNYDEKFWDRITEYAQEDAKAVTARTRKTNFVVSLAAHTSIWKDGKEVTTKKSFHTAEKKADATLNFQAEQGGSYVVIKYVSVLSSLHHEEKIIQEKAIQKVKTLRSSGYDNLKKAHETKWKERWEECDITIAGDMAAQQGIRFNIFQLMQTYTGEDARLNIGPKGFTGEKYGGSTYWDTEAYCLPFYLSTSPEKVSRQLLVYRYEHLQKAIENAAKLGFTNGAALYPMVTMNGEECHNEWEITFEEIHRNGAIAFAIFDYIRYTGDEKYLAEYGAEVLIGIARFWAQRIHFSQDKQQYVMLGVTGPNEYENNVNNNWYTSYIACWTLEYAAHAVSYCQQNGSWKTIASKLKFDEKELEKWKDIRANMYFAYDEKRKIFLQQDGFLDKELIPVSALSSADRPLNQKWSWDRILRSCFIKQADVLQGIYLFEERFDKETIKRNFDFYEPMTVHESSLSPCVHVILASLLGYEEKAYEMYLRTSRLDLDDYNNDTEDGCHITSMAGTWMSVVKGFGGMRVNEGKLSFQPFIPSKWASFSFRIKFRGTTLQVTITNDKTDIKRLHGNALTLTLNGKEITV